MLRVRPDDDNKPKIKQGNKSGTSSTTTGDNLVIEQPKKLNEKDKRKKGKKDCC